MGCPLYLGSGATENRSTPADIQARGLRVIDLLENRGPQQLGNPTSSRQGKLWEIRLKGRAGIAPALCTLPQVHHRLCVVRVFVEKNPEAPRAEIELALRHIAEVERNGKRLKT